MKALESCTPEESQFIHDVLADPNDESAVREAEDKVLDVLEGHVG